MITELGHIALILALCVALVQSTVPMLGAARGDAGWMAVGRNTALAQFGLVALAMLALMHAYVTSDFSVINVVQNSHTDKPLLYKITGVWGNHEGSMLLWIFMLNVCGAALALFSGNLPPELRARVLAVHGMIAVGFLVFILFTSNPFLRQWPPAENGHGLNPVLGSRPRVPPAVSVSRLRRVFRRLLLRRRRPDRRSRRCRVGALGQAMVAGLVVLPDGRYRDGQLVGLLHVGLGRLVVLGPGGERVVHAMAGRHRADPFVDRGGEA